STPQLSAWVISPESGHSIAEQAFESCWRQLRITNGMLYRFVAQISLDRTRIHASIGELVATGMAQHVRMDFQSRQPHQLAPPSTGTHGWGRGGRGQL